MKSAAIAISLSLLVGSAAAQSLRSQLDASNKAIDKYMLAKDMKNLKKHMKEAMTQDFTYVEEGKSMNFDTMFAGMEMGLGQMKKLTKVQSKTLNVREKGNTATATIWHTMEATTLGPDKKAHVMSFTGTSENTLVKQGGKWKMSKMTWLKQTMKMDGKPFSAAGVTGK